MRADPGRGHRTVSANVRRAATPSASRAWTTIRPPAPRGVPLSAPVRWTSARAPALIAAVARYAVISCQRAGRLATGHPALETSVGAHPGTVVTRRLQVSPSRRPLRRERIRRAPAWARPRRRSQERAHRHYGEGPHVRPNAPALRHLDRNPSVDRMKVEVGAVRRELRGTQVDRDSAEPGKHGPAPKCRGTALQIDAVEDRDKCHLVAFAVAS